MIKKIVHIILAFFILVSTTGLTINLHYCHDQLYDLAVFAPAHSCCEPGVEVQCHSTEGLSDMNHCNDESLALESTDDYTISSFAFNFENSYNFDILLSSVLYHSFQNSDNSNSLDACRFYKPPPYQEVILSQIQSFLI